MSVTQIPELGVKTENHQLQKRLSVFTQYWFLRPYVQILHSDSARGTEAGSEAACWRFVRGNMEREKERLEEGKRGEGKIQRREEGQERRNEGR